MQAAVSPTTAADDAILVEPLSPAVGLEVRGVDLDTLSDELAAMVRDLWQVGGALLFRGCADPARCAAALGRAIAGKTLIAVSASIPGSAEWSMVGADGTASLPLACVVGTGDAALPPLWLAGMEAAADSLRMTAPETLKDAEGLHFAHSLDGPMRPVLLEHPLTGATVLYPPPRRAASQDPVGQALVRTAEEPQFGHCHAWQPGDVLAWDPRAVRARWDEAPAEDSATFAIVRAASSLPAKPDWELPV
ncbi:MAG: hypothetical protein H6844_11345 [Alphaproteobacteria bacterium]|nr:hypothetical protein [Alphaproteobacteria bacterium]